LVSEAYDGSRSRSGGNRNRNKRTDLKSEKNFHTNPNPKDRRAYLGFPHRQRHHHRAEGRQWCRSWPARGTEHRATLHLGEHRAARKRTSDGNRAPPCGPSTVACSALGEHSRRREGAGRRQLSSPSRHGQQLLLVLLCAAQMNEGEKGGTK
jgi:hypothetical protein